MLNFRWCPLRRSVPEPWEISAVETGGQVDRTRLRAQLIKARSLSLPLVPEAPAQSPFELRQ